MTSNNIKEHLSWLLKSRCFIPPASIPGTTATESTPIANVEADNLAPSQADDKPSLHGTHDDQYVDAGPIWTVEATTQAVPPPASAVGERPTVAPRAGDPAAMVKLQSAPMTSTKPRMRTQLDLQTSTTRNAHSGSEVARRASLSELHNASFRDGTTTKEQTPSGPSPVKPASYSTPTRVTRASARASAAKSTAAIDSIDLTGDGQLVPSSSGTVETFGESEKVWREEAASRSGPLPSSGRKRKSDGTEVGSPPFSPTAKRKQASARPATDVYGSEDFVAIDSYPNEAPPPYSTALPTATSGPRGSPKKTKVLVDGLSDASSPSSVDDDYEKHTLTETRIVYETRKKKSTSYCSPDALWKAKRQRADALSPINGVDSLRAGPSSPAGVRPSRRPYVEIPAKSPQSPGKLQELESPTQGPTTKVVQDSDEDDEYDEIIPRRFDPLEDGNRSLPRPTGESSPVQGKRLEATHTFDAALAEFGHTESNGPARNCRPFEDIPAVAAAKSSAASPFHRDSPTKPFVAKGKQRATEVNPSSSPDLPEQEKAVVRRFMLLSPAVIQQYQDSVQVAFGANKRLVSECLDADRPIPHRLKAERKQLKEQMEAWSAAVAAKHRFSELLANKTDLKRRIFDAMDEDLELATLEEENSKISQENRQLLSSASRLLKIILSSSMASEGLKSQLHVEDGSRGSKRAAESQTMVQSTQGVDDGSQVTSPRRNRSYSSGKVKQTQAPLYPPSSPTSRGRPMKREALSPERPAVDTSTKSSRNVMAPPPLRPPRQTRTSCGDNPLASRPSPPRNSAIPRTVARSPPLVMQSQQWGHDGRQASFRGSHLSAGPTSVLDTQFIPSDGRHHTSAVPSAAAQDQDAFEEEYFPFSDPEDLPHRRRTGSPEKPILCDERDEYEHDAEDEEMLGMADDLENRNSRQSHSASAEHRRIFGETAGNSVPANDLRATPKAKSADQAFPIASSPNSMMQHAWSRDVKAAMKERFHLRGFRQNQLEAINATLGGKDAFVLMPTGGGKSLCYQLPAIIGSGKTRGVTVVISPLLSLMQDQVDHLKALNIQAFLFNGEVTAEHRRLVMQGLQDPNVEQLVQLLYVTPEMITKSGSLTNAFENLYRRHKLARIVIDEAHCVSQWGHDFRPEYKKLGEIRSRFSGVPVMALTATATENVKVDVIHNLNIQGCELFNQSFNRPNLTYEVRKKTTAKAVLESIAETIQAKYKGMSGIIYCLSRKDCEKVAAQMNDEYHIRSHHYHAAMNPADKRQVQKDWQAGRHHVIVATIAFGMGIDKADVRFVFHHSISKTLEGYYQETGRAGRDGKQSGCYLYYGYKDATIFKRFIDESDASFEQKERNRQMLRKMIQFCENKSDCRRVQVLAYFNETFRREDCNNGCDNCNSESVFESHDYTEDAVLAIRLVKRMERASVTVLQCADLFRGQRSKKQWDGIDPTQFPEFGKGSSMDRQEIERLFYRLVGEEALEERNTVNRGGFPNITVHLGRNSNEFTSGRRRVKLQVRVSPRAPGGKKTKKPAAGKSKKGAAAASHDYPQSTNVSSPIQQAARRRNARAQPALDARAAHAHGLHDGDIDVPDGNDDDDLYGGAFDEEAEETSDDGFDPVRIAGRPRRPARPPLGPPITMDEKMDRLNEIHRAVVEDFVGQANREGERIRSDRGLRAQPFTDSIYREMAINFPRDEGELLEIPNIDPAKVHLFGRKFLALVRNAHSAYENMMAQVDERDQDPNHNVVISISSDDDGHGGGGGLAAEDDEDEDYGGAADIPSNLEDFDFGDDDDDDDDDEYGHRTSAPSQPSTGGERSQYFQPNPNVHAFNAQFSQLPEPPPPAQQTAPASQIRQYAYRGGGPSARGGGGSSKGSFARRGGYGARKGSSSTKGRSSGGSRVSKKGGGKGSSRTVSGGSSARSGGSAFGGGGARRGSRGGGGVGIGMMPT